MNTTITLGEAGLILLGAALLVLIIYFILLIKNLVVTVKSANKIMADVQVISGVAAEGAQEASKLVTDVSQSVGSISELIKGNKSTVTALTNLINAVAALRNLATKTKK